MRAFSRPIFCSLVCLSLAACGGTSPQQQQQPAAASNSPAASNVDRATPSQEGGAVSSTDVVKASAAPAEVAAGSASNLSVKLQIAEGYHVNANPPTFAYLKATELSVEVGEGLSAGKPVYPKAVTRKFEFAEKPLAVYEGDAEIKLPLKAEAGTGKGTRTLAARLRVQACDEKACYPPGTLNVPIALTIK